MADLVWSDPDPDKEEFAISPRFVCVALIVRRDPADLMLRNRIEARDTLSELKSFVNFLKSIQWFTFYARINCVWKDIACCLMIRYQRFGQHQIIATDVGIWPVFWKSQHRTVVISTCFQLHRRMNEMVQVNKRRSHQ